MSNLPKVTIYTDGGCNPNPGPGGWGVVLLFDDKEPPAELVGKESHTTNNRMELRAATEALRSLYEPHEVTLYTDSTYVRQGITTWLPEWEKRNWQTSDNRAVKNQDLWQSLSGQQQRHQVSWKWVKGHAGNKWNERADELASSQIPRPKLPLDDETAIHIFTAAAYSGKAKRGGWGVVLRYREHRKTFSGQVEDTSSNRMHIQSAIEGLQAIKQTKPIHIYTSSDYLKDGATRWVKGWMARNWQTKTGKSVSHRDLWETVTQFNQTYQIRWHVISKKELTDEMKQAKTLATEAVRQELDKEA